MLIIITGYFYFKGKKKLNSQASSDEKTVQNEGTENEKIHLTVKIDGMACEKCAARVTEALEKFGKVTVNLKEKNAVIECDELPDTKEVEDAVNTLGYKYLGIE